jgi:hypothetical protein
MGIEVGIKARLLWPNGVLVDTKYDDYAEALKCTKALIADPTVDLPLRPAADIGAVEDRFFTLRNVPLTDGTVMPEATIGYPDVEPAKSPAEPMVRGLSAGGKRIRTIGPAPRAQQNCGTFYRGEGNRMFAASPMRKQDSNPRSRHRPP